MKNLLLFISFLSIAFSAFAQSQTLYVQISDSRDASGHFTAWADIEVTWESEVVTDTPDASATDDDKLQEWFIPVKGGWLGFSFERSKLGEYAIRWSSDGTIWSEPGVCEIKRPRPAKHKDQ